MNVMKYYRKRNRSASSTNKNGIETTVTEFAEAIKKVAANEKKMSN